MSGYGNCVCGFPLSCCTCGDPICRSCDPDGCPGLAVDRKTYPLGDPDLIAKDTVHSGFLTADPDGVSLAQAFIDMKAGQTDDATGVYARFFYQNEDGDEFGPFDTFAEASAGGETGEVDLTLLRAASQTSTGVDDLPDASLSGDPAPEAPDGS